MTLSDHSDILRACYTTKVMRKTVHSLSGKNLLAELQPSLVAIRDYKHGFGYFASFSQFLNQMVGTQVPDVKRSKEQDFDLGFDRRPIFLADFARKPPKNAPKTTFCLGFWGDKHFFEIAQ